MLRTIFMASSMLVAGPVFAQDAPAQERIGATQHPPAATNAAAPATTAEKAQKTDDQAPGTQGAGTAEEATPAGAATAPAAEAAQPTPAQPAPSAAPAQPDTATGTTGAGTVEAAPTAAARPAATADQVAQAVDRDFANYDKDANGTLSQAEFGSWMTSLRQAAQPGFQPGSAEAGTWLAQAFASSDTDKNQSVSKVELTTFLTPKAQ